MKNPLMVTRRIFIMGSLSTWFLHFFHRDANAGKYFHPRRHQLKINALIGVMQEQAFRNDDVISDQQKANLAYAFDRINPENHLDKSVAVAFSMSHQKMFKIIDKYAQRKYDEAFRFSEHPMRMLKSWGVPETHGMLIFREQVDTLLAKLTGISSPALCRRISNRIMRGLIGLTEFSDMLSHKYRAFGKAEIIALYDAITYYAPLARPYTWCSTMVNRAEAKLSISR